MQELRGASRSIPLFLSSCEQLMIGLRKFTRTTKF
ncbi:unnamed protein product [Oikopleura dioica]|uniref:Uncharacterized protein n=1 Tax=Oikopleura dioica TaxID=34765 RepID=E4Y474_OIKDI|nr:unnamed protein product [Oikopleura dioica]